MAGVAAGFGEQLRGERERKGVSLEAVCAETKIQPKHLTALEDEDFAALPGGVFRKGIVRAYLRALGLAEEEWLPRFEQSLRAQVEAGRVADDGNAAWAEFAENVRRTRTGARQSRPWRWVGVVLLLLVVGAAAYAVWRYLLARHLVGGSTGLM